MILAKTCYKTHDREYLPIVKAFKTWRNYLVGCKHEVLVYTDYSNNLCQAPNKSAEPKSFPDTIFELTTTKIKPPELLMPYLAFFKESLRKKKSFELTILKSFIIYRFY